MVYAIRYLRQAREEADDLRETYGREFAQDFDKWLVCLAEAAQEDRAAGTLDILDVLEREIEEKPTTIQWCYSWKRFNEATMRERLRALLVVIRKRCPPWEYRMSSKWFVLLGQISAEIQVYYAIDRPNKRVVFHLFELVWV